MSEQQKNMAQPDPEEAATKPSALEVRIMRVIFFTVLFLIVVTTVLTLVMAFIKF